MSSVERTQKAVRGSREREGEAVHALIHVNYYITHQRKGLEYYYLDKPYL